MAYQDATFIGTGAISKLFTSAASTNGIPGTPVIAGSISVASGDCWVRKLRVATATQNGPVQTGAPNFFSNPGPSGYVDGWIHLNTGATHDFGGERVAEGAGTSVDPVLQIDIWLNGPVTGGPGEVTITAH